MSTDTFINDFKWRNVKWITNIEMKTQKIHKSHKIHNTIHNKIHSTIQKTQTTLITINFKNALIYNANYSFNDIR